MRLQEDIAERMRDPAFAAAYEALEPEFQVARQVIALRLQRGLTQKELAQQVGTKQSGISRLESMAQLKIRKRQGRSGAAIEREAPMTAKILVAEDDESLTSFLQPMLNEPDSR